VAIVILTAVLPQSRAGMFIGLALWAGLCGFSATILRNVASYGAALAGFTAAGLFSDVVVTPNETFLLAFTRTSEITIGIASVVLVMVFTDAGSARRRLADGFADMAHAVASGMATLPAGGTESLAAREVRRQLIRQVIALDRLIDEAIGEAADLRIRAGTLQRGIEGLFLAISAWRGMANHLDALGHAAAEVDMEADALGAIMRGVAAVDWRQNPTIARARCRLAAQRVLTMPAATPSERFRLDQAWDGLTALERSANAICLVVWPGTERLSRHSAPLTLPDSLPAIVNGLRAVVALLAAEILWAATDWSVGQAVITFAAVAVTVFSPHGDDACRNVLGYAMGTVAAFVLAAVCNFAALPAQTDFAGFSLVLCCVLLPLGALSAGPWGKTFFAALVINFLAILSPQNQPSYDPVSFFNTGIAIIAGSILGCLCMCLLPQVPPRGRARRLLALTTRDLRRLAIQRRWLGRADWTSLVFCRLEAMPREATPEQLAQVVAALSVGEAVIRLRDGRPVLAGQESLDRALRALASGDVSETCYWLSVFSAAQLALPADVPALRGQAAALLIAEALNRHSAFFAAVPHQRAFPFRFRSAPRYTS